MNFFFLRAWCKISLHDLTTRGSEEKLFFHGAVLRRTGTNGRGSKTEKQGEKTSKIYRRASGYARSECARPSHPSVHDFIIDGNHSIFSESHFPRTERKPPNENIKLLLNYSKLQLRADKKQLQTISLQQMKFLLKILPTFRPLSRIIKIVFSTTLTAAPNRKTVHFGFACAAELHFIIFRYVDDF